MYDYCFWAMAYIGYYDVNTVDYCSLVLTRNEHRPMEVHNIYILLNQAIVQIYIYIEREREMYELEIVYDMQYFWHKQ